MGRWEPRESEPKESERQVLSNVIELETQPVGLVRFDAGIEGPKGFRRPWVAFMRAIWGVV